MKRWHVSAVLALAVMAQPSFGYAQTATTLKRMEELVLVEQPDGVTCGPTSAMMVLDYCGVKTDIAKLRVVCGTSELGTLPAGISKGLQAFGQPATVRTSTFAELIGYIKEDRPPIVLLKLGTLPYGKWRIPALHYVVLVGIEDEFVLLADPSDARRIERMPKESFEHAWGFGRRKGDSDWLCQTVEYFTKANTIVVPDKPVSPPK